MAGWLGLWLIDSGFGGVHRLGPGVGGLIAEDFRTSLWTLLGDCSSWCAAYCFKAKESVHGHLPRFERTTEISERLATLSPREPESCTP